MSKDQPVREEDLIPVTPGNEKYFCDHSGEKIYKKTEEGLVPISSLYRNSQKPEEDSQANTIKP